jgi:CRISPR/Cas system CMR subunit Cmr4 (Cas7 group RAMP superfamily)
MIEIKYKLKFRSDFHFGSGAGIPGVIDCGLKYNSNGVPEISGKTIKGILRDAVTNIILLQSPKLSGCSIVENIFGKEGQDDTKFRFSTPVIPEQYEKRISESRNLQKSITKIEFHNRIHRNSNIAEKGALFSREVGPNSFEYAGRISQIKECFHNKELKKYIYYLVCGMRFITHIGGNRRRGKGLVRFEIEEIQDKDNGRIFEYKKIIEKGIEE